MTKHSYILLRSPTYENYLLLIKSQMVRYGKTMTYLLILLTLRSRNTPYNY